MCVHVCVCVCVCVCVVCVCVCVWCKPFLGLQHAELRRHYYTTPTSYLELINLYLSMLQTKKRFASHTHTHTHAHTHTHTHTHTCTHTKKHVANCLCAQNTCVLCIFIFNFKFEYYCAWIFFRQLTNSRERIATGLKKILETNELVTNMEVLQYTCMLKLYEAFSTRLSWRN